MSLKFSLILLTVVAVISDSMLHPFYPQYFATVYGVTDPMHVGLYIASCSLTVMLLFPVWALVARRIPVLQLLIGTQAATGVLSIVCYWTTSLWLFWSVSLLMMVFKASYLLIYPYLMSLEKKDKHITTISLLAFVVYFGNILAALGSGLVFELLAPRFLFVVMAGGDLVQIGICLLMIRQGGLRNDARQPEETGETAPVLTAGFVYKLGLVMFVLYFSAYLSEPFFSLYWEWLAASDNKIVSSAVFAIPGITALLALYLNAKRRHSDRSPYARIVPAIVLGICGLLLQASAQQPAVLMGRFLYGWALFQSMVRLDLLLFRLSTPASYAVDFSKVHFFQGLGILFSSFAAGSLVDALGLKIPFIAAACGFCAGALLYRYLFRTEFRAVRMPAPVQGAASET
jgi:MFS family permease